MTNAITAQAARDTAAANLTQAQDNLAQANADLAEIKATIVELDRAYDSDEALPRNHQSKVDTAQGRLIQLSRAVERREAAVTKAQAVLEQAETGLTEERLVMLAEKCLDFDQAAWVEKVRAACQPIIDQHLDELYEVKGAWLALDRELRADGRHEYPRNQHAGRVGMTAGSYKDPTLDGQAIIRIAPEKIVERIGDALVDTRHEEQVRQARAELAAEKAEEQRLRDEAAAEWRRAHESTVSPAEPGSTVSRDSKGNEITITARHSGRTQNPLRRV